VAPQPSAVAAKRERTLPSSAGTPGAGGAARAAKTGSAVRRLCDVRAACYRGGDDAVGGHHEAVDGLDIGDSGIPALAAVRPGGEGVHYNSIEATLISLLKQWRDPVVSQNSDDAHAALL